MSIINNNEAMLQLCIEASNQSYAESKDVLSAGHELVRTSSNKLSGFYGTCYKSGNDIIIGFAGAKTPIDKIAVGKLMLGGIDKQYYDALNFYWSIKDEFPGANITVTGGSLGGSLAQLVAASTGCNGIALNPFGCKHLLPSLGLRDDVEYPNIKNYRASGDILYIGEGRTSEDCVGTTYIVPTDENLLDAVNIHQNLDLLKNHMPISSEIWENNSVGPTIAEGFKKQFNQAGNAGPVGVDPILVDLNGDGIIGTTSVENGVYFDHEKDCFAEHSAWVDKNDGILIIDKNNNGKLDNGNEIFGDNYVKSNGQKATNGFDALRDLDSNNDGIISADDAEFSNIKILKGDRTLLTLEEAGIVSISLKSTAKNMVDENGNTLVSSGTFVKEDGTIGNLGDFNLVVDKMNSFATEWVEVSEDVELLPDVKGFGMVRSLHQAIMRDGSGVLKGLVEEFIAAESEADKKEILGQILYKWTGAENVSVSSGGYHYDGQKLYVMEQFIGEEFKGVNNDGMPNVWAAPLLDNCYEQIMDYVYYSLMVQCDEHTKTLYNMFELEYDFESNKVKYNFDKVMGYIDEGFKEGKEVGKNRVLEIAKLIEAFGIDKQNGYEEYYEYLNNMGGEYTAILETIGKIVINGTDEADVIEGTTGADAVFAGGGDDNIKTRQGDDLVYGGDGNDTIDTCEGNDVIYAGTGDDSILGGEGNNIIYGEDGNDTIVGGNGNDTIYGGDGDDSIKSGRGYDIIYGGLGNDTIKLDQGNATVYGGDGNDDIVVVNGINLIEAGDGNDTITVNAHNTNTTIIGGLGDDYINMNVQPYSQAGNVVETICKYNLGDGNDTIDINGFTKRQILEFGEGITRDDLILSGLNDDLIITFKDHEGSITLKRFLYDMGIEKFVFSNGDEILRKNAMYGLKTYGDDNDNYLIGSTSNEAIYGYGGNDTIYAKDSNDTIYGGDGDDYIDPGKGSDFVYAGSGNDTIKFGDHDGHNPSNYIDGGDGDDYIETRNGNNTVIGGKGNDNIKGSSAKDTYIYNLGDGNDTIVTYGENDILEFGEGITRENTIFRGVGHDLLITFKDSEGSIIIKNPLYNNSFKIEKFKFANGEELSYSYVVSHLTPIEGTEGNDSIKGSYASEIIYGNGGNDSIDGGYGNDTIYGGDGDDSLHGNFDNDTVYGGDGNDTLVNGINNGSDLLYGEAGDDYFKIYSGNDTIVGGVGNDTVQCNSNGNNTYIYNIGDGNDVINEYGGNDVIRFGEGITRENIIFRGENQDLVISFKDDEGSIRITDCLSNSGKRIENYGFADGTVLTYNEMLAIKDSQDALELSQNMVSSIEQNDTDDAIAACISTSDINKIIQDMTAYNTAEEGMISYSEDINQEKELMTLVNS